MITMLITAVLQVLHNPFEQDDDNFLETVSLTLLFMYPCTLRKIVVHFDFGLDILVSWIMAMKILSSG